MSTASAILAVHTDPEVNQRKQEIEAPIEHVKPSILHLPKQLLTCRTFIGIMRTASAFLKVLTEITLVCMRQGSCWIAGHI